MFDKKYIEENIFNKDGNVNKNFTRAKKFQPFIKFLQDKEGDTIQEKLYLFYHNINKPTCECGEYTTFLGFSKGYRKYCSAKCRANSKEFKEQVKKSNLEKYGVESTNQILEVKNKKIKTYGKNKHNHKDFRKTNLKKYGVEYPLQKKDFFDKMKKTKKQKYGDEKYNNPKKAEITRLEKYGVSSLLLDDSYKQNFLNKSKKTKVLNIYNRLKKSEKYKPLFSVEDFNGVYYTNKYKWKCLECGTEFYDDLYAGREPRCPECYPKNQPVSQYEKELETYLTQFKTIKNSRKIIPPYEIDIYLPDHNLAIEFNGLYWHSTEWKDKYYHQNKVKMCHEKSIRLLHIWEDDWLNNPEEVKENILHYINNLDEEVEPREPILEKRMGYKIWT